MLNYNAFYYFLELCSAGSFTVAAENLHLTRSALSIAIKNLEQELGFSLFTRSHDGVTLTTEGKEVSKYVKIAFSAFKNIELLSIKNKQTFNLSIYTSSGGSEKIIPFIVSEYNKLYPGGNISIFPIGNLSIEEIFLKTQDALILNIYEENYLFPAATEHIILEKAPAVLAINKDAQFISSDINSILMKDIVNLPLISVSNGENQNFQNKMMSYIRKYGEPNIVFTTHSTSMMHSLLSEKIGVMFYPHFKNMINNSFNMDYVRFLKIKKAPKFILALCYSKNMSDEKITFVTNFFKRFCEV